MTKSNTVLGSEAINTSNIQIAEKNVWFEKVDVETTFNKGGANVSMYRVMLKGSDWREVRKHVGRK